MNFGIFIGIRTLLLLPVLAVPHGEQEGPILNYSIYDDLQRKLTDGSSYNRQMRPGLDLASIKPLTVKVFLFVTSIREVSPKTMDYRITILYRERWKDERLKFDPNLYQNVSSIILSKDLTDLIWKTDTYFPNAVESNEDDDKVKTLLRLDKRGYILWGRRISITAECPMDLSLYPFDEQFCELQIESYGNPTYNVVYEWLALNAVEIGKISLPDLHLDRHVLTSRNISFATGNYTRLIVCFVFGRSKGYYFVQLFVPAAAVVMTTWFTLWMRNEATFSDMINLMLTITLLYFSYNTLMPKVSYIKAMFACLICLLDLYLVFCFLQVVLALIKTAMMRLLLDWGYLEMEQSFKIHHDEQVDDGSIWGDRPIGGAEEEKNAINRFKQSVIKSRSLSNSSQSAKLSTAGAGVGGMEGDKSSGRKGGIRDRIGFSYSVVDDHHQTCPTNNGKSSHVHQGRIALDDNNAIGRGGGPKEARVFRGKISRHSVERCFTFIGFILPLTFVIFCFIYFIVYFLLAENEKKNVCNA